MHKFFEVYFNNRKKGMENQIFKEYRYRVINCDNTTCKLYRYKTNNNYIEPIQLIHKDPKKVRVLIITEQPKILKGSDKLTNKTFFCNKEERSTITQLIAILGCKFNYFIDEKDGPFYWTHHTKCPHHERKPQSKCMEKYFTEEIECFANLKLLIAFGSHPYPHIEKNNHNKDNIPNKYFEYFYRLLEENINEKYTYPKICIKKKEIIFLALPHPSKNNSLRLFLPKMKNMIDDYIQHVL